MWNLAVMMPPPLTDADDRTSVAASKNSQTVLKNLLLHTRQAITLAEHVLDRVDVAGEDPITNLTVKLYFATCFVDCEANDDAAVENVLVGEFMLDVCTRYCFSRHCSKARLNVLILCVSARHSLTCWLPILYAQSDYLNIV
jgi:hypothetical protein